MFAYGQVTGVAEEDASGPLQLVPELQCNEDERSVKV